MKNLHPVRLENRILNVYIEDIILIPNSHAIVIKTIRKSSDGHPVSRFSVHGKNTEQYDSDTLTSAG